MNLILWVEGSSAAIPFGTLVAILALWFGISVPLTFVGAYFGFKKPVSLASMHLLCNSCDYAIQTRHNQPRVRTINQYFVVLCSF